MTQKEIDLEIFLFKRATYSLNPVSEERQKEIDKRIVELWGLDICL